MRWLWCVFISIGFVSFGQDMHEEETTHKPGIYAQVSAGPSVPLTGSGGYAPGPMRTGFTTGFGGRPLRLMVDYNKYWGVSFSVLQFYHRYHSKRINRVLTDLGFHEHVGNGSARHGALQTGFYIYLKRSRSFLLTWAFDIGIGQSTSSHIAIFRERSHPANFNHSVEALEVMSYKYDARSSRDYYVNSSFTVSQNIGSTVLGFFTAELGYVPYYDASVSLFANKDLMAQLPFGGYARAGAYPYLNFWFGLRYTVHRK